MQNNTMNSQFEGVQPYETPLCEVFEISTEKTILSNQPGKPGDYNSDDDIVDGEF